MEPINEVKAVNIFYGAMTVVMVAVFFAFSVMEYGFFTALFWFGMGAGFIGFILLMMFGPNLLQWFWNRYLVSNHHTEEDNES